MRAAHPPRVTWPARHEELADNEAAHQLGRDSERKHPAAERLRRIWNLVEEIASSPGRTRREIAHDYTLSERQIQDDLNFIRVEMGLPLIRRKGYRFRNDAADLSPQFTLAEAQLLLMLLRRASQDPSLPTERLRTLMQKLPQLFPLHLRPLVARTLDAAESRRAGREHEIFAALAEALLQKSYVKLHYPLGQPVSSVTEPIVQPEVLFPYLNTWHVVGNCRQRGKIMIFDISTLVAVTPASGL